MSCLKNCKENYKRNKKRKDRARWGKPTLPVEPCD